MRVSIRGALFLWLCLLAANGVASQTFEIAKIVDGDTVILEDGRHIRLIGINTPEIGKKGRPDQPLAREARQRLKKLVKTGVSRLTKGKQAKDHYDRTLAYLDIKKSGSSELIDVQQLMLEEGLAWLVAIPPNISRIERYRKSQLQAKKQKRGIWNLSSYRAKNAGKLKSGDTGFQRVTGKIRKIGRSRKFLYLNFHPNNSFSVRITHKNWNKYFQAHYSPDFFIKKNIMVSGWISKQRGDKLGMRVGHPAMIEIIN